MSTTPQLELIRARTVLPITREPIDDGAVLISSGSIEEVGKFRALAKSHAGASVTDWGETILMPGLVNAHCHLDYTAMAGQIARPKSFPDWIKAILALKAQWSYSEYAESWLAGARQLVESGTTTVADIEAVPELLPEVWTATPLRVISLLEMTGVRAGGQPLRILNEALARIGKLPKSELNSAGLSPHALYSTPPELLRLTGQKLRRSRVVCAIHAGESVEEWEMYKNASGPLYDWLKTQRPMDDCGGRSPIEQLRSLRLLNPQLLVVHANYLGPKDPDLLMEAGASVVHCPRSHAYFKHAPFEFEKLRKKRVNIALGTDSLASVIKKRGKQFPELNMWEELQLFGKSHPELSPAELLPLVTINGGLALNKSVGAIAAGFHADLIAVEAATEEQLLDGRVFVRQRMIGGRHLP